VNHSEPADMNELQTYSPLVMVGDDAAQLLFPTLFAPSSTSSSGAGDGVME
jgi:hypothetical protein